MRCYRECQAHVHAARVSFYRCIDKFRELGKSHYLIKLSIDLAFFRGMSQREIAAKTNTPLGTVKTRLELGLKKIYDGLKEFRDEL